MTSFTINRRDEASSDRSRTRTTPVTITPPRSSVPRFAAGAAWSGDLCVRLISSCIPTLMIQCFEISTMTKVDAGNSCVKSHDFCLKARTTMFKSLLLPVTARSTFGQILKTHAQHCSSMRLVSTSTLQGRHESPSARSPRTKRPLARLPLTHVLRSYLIMSMSSSSLLLNTTTWIIHKMLVSKSFMFNPDRNPILKWVFHKTVYSQFCAGENEAQVQKTLSNLHEIGYHGVSLEYAKEVIDGQDEAGVELSAAETIKAWRNGLLQTVAMANSGDFVSLK